MPSRRPHNRFALKYVSEEIGTRRPWGVPVVPKTDAEDLALIRITELKQGDDPGARLGFNYTKDARNFRPIVIRSDGTIEDPPGTAARSDDRPFVAGDDGG